MVISEILEIIDLNITQLQQARALLTGGVNSAPKKAVGRPKKAVGRPTKAVTVSRKAAAAVPAAKPAKTRTLSPEGRKRIADAAKKRWAAKKSADTK